jgi:hypothetical protein
MLMQSGLDVSDIGEVSQNAGAEADLFKFHVLSAHIHPAIPGIAKTV